MYKARFKQQAWKSVSGSFHSAKSLVTGEMNEMTVCPSTITIHSSHQTSGAKPFPKIQNITHTHPFNGPLSGTTRVSRHQEGKSNVDFTEASDGEWQWHPLGHMQVCTSVQLDNHTRLFRANYVILPGV